MQEGICKFHCEFEEAVLYTTCTSKSTAFFNFLAFEFHKITLILWYKVVPQHRHLQLLLFTLYSSPTNGQDQKNWAAKIKISRGLKQMCISSAQPNFVMLSSVVIFNDYTIYKDNLILEYPVALLQLYQICSLSFHLT
jgi:hypothetical protein